MTARTFRSPSHLLDHVGDALGTSGWVTVDQERVDTFARATDDHQWIHVDPARAAEGPFGGTIAHGFLTLSMAPTFLPEVMHVDGCALVLNYGLGRVRFPAPVLVGSRLRGTGRLDAAEPIVGGVQATVGLTVEIEGATKPACVAELVMRFMA